MDFLNDFHFFSDVTAPPGVNVWPRLIGKLTSFSGIRHVLGGYICLHYIEKGRGWIKYNDSIQELKSGEMFCLKKNIEIEFYDDPDDPWQYYWLHLEGEDCENVVNSLGFEDSKPWNCPDEPERVLDIFKRIHGMARERLLPKSNSMASIMFELFDAISSSEPYALHNRERLVDNAKAVINSQMHTSLNVNEIAEILGVERTTLYHAFRGECGCSPIEYLRRKRIERACKILKNSQHSISETAKICGFSNSKYFTRTFCKLTGESPRDYRKNNN